MSLNAFSKYGRFAVSLPTLVGKTFFVSSDSAVINRMRSMFPPDEEGSIRVFATLDEAVNACTANRGDKIIIGEGHTETLSTAGAVALDVAGVEVIGMGNGADRPQFTFDSITGASMTISAASVKVKNIIGVAGLDGLTLPFHVTGDDCELDIEWRDASSTVEAETVVRLDTANNCKLSLVYKGFTAGNAAVRVVAIDDCDNVEIDIETYGVVLTAWVNMVDAASTNVTVRGRMYTEGITDFSRNVVDTIGGSTWDADLWDSSFGGHISGGSAAALASDDVSALAAVLGTPVNTGGTATISAILGDPANTSLSSRVDTVKEELSGTGIAVFPVGAAPGNGVSMAAALRATHLLASTVDQNLTGALGIVTWNAGAAAGNGVSMSESLRYAQEGIRQDGGTPMAATKSVADALGSDGTTVTDSAISVLGAIGADNNNNAFSSTNVVADADGSVLERLEAIQQHVGATDSVTNILGANDADNGFDSSSVVSNGDGSIVERLEWIQANVGDVGGLVVKGTCDAGMIASTTAIVAAGLGGYGDDYFNTKYYMQVLKNASAVGTAPETEIRQITDYVSATGTFTVTAFTVNVEASDEIFIMHESLVAVGRDDANNTFATTNIVANVDGTVLERLEDLKDRVDTVDNILDTEFPVVATAVGAVADAALADTIEGAAAATQSILTDLKGVLQRLGADNADNTAATTLVAANRDGSVLERLEAIYAAQVDDGTTNALGVNDADNLFDSSLVVANVDGSILERLEDLVVKVTAVDDYVDTEVAAIKADTDKIDDATLAVSPVAGSLARFIASGGTALGTQLADSKSLVDALGTNGTTVADSAVSVLGAIGADNADNAFASTLVASNADGSVLERQEYVQAQIGALVNTGGTATLGGIIGDVANVTLASRLTTIDDFLDTEVAAIKAETDQIGTIVNTGGTATVGGVLGDFANTSLVSRLDTIDDFLDTEIAAIKVDTDKIEDATLSVSPTAGSLARFIATGGTALGTELPASNSLYDMVRRYGDGFVATKTITYDGSASYAAFTVTGAVFARVLGTIDTALSNVAATTSVGTTTSAAGLIAATAGTAMQTIGNTWTDSAPSNFESPIDLQATALISGSEGIVVDGDVTLAAGVVTLYCFWKPLGSGTLVAA